MFRLQNKNPVLGPYLGDMWKVRVELPDAYPYKSLSIGFVNKIYNPNVNEMSSSVCLDVINQTWSPMFDLVNVFEVFFPQLLLYPNPSDPLNGEAAALMMRDRTTYDQRVKGTLYTMAEIVGEFEGEYTAYMVDAGSTIIASTLGVSPIATFIELSAGIREGGRTKITAIIVGFYFLLSLFFTPLIASVPPWTIGSSLLRVGVLMMKVVKDINWNNIKHAVPAFVTMVLMPLTYSIANGIIGGIEVYVALSLYDNMVCWVKWLMRMKKMMVKEQNQVSATADQSIEVVQSLKTN